MATPDHFPAPEDNQPVLPGLEELVPRQASSPENLNPGALPGVSTEDVAGRDRGFEDADGNGEYTPQQEVAMNQGVATPYMINGGTQRGVRPAASDAAAASSKRRSLPASRRGGRSYPDPGDSELDENWKPPFTPLSEEQREINRRGAALVREALRQHREDQRPSEVEAPEKSEPPEA